MPRLTCPTLSARLILALGVPALALAGCAQTPLPSTPAASMPSPEAPAASESPTAASPSASIPVAGATCTARAAAMSLAEQAGQVVMMGVTGSLDAAEKTALRSGSFGSVILMGNTTDGVAGAKARTDAIQEAGGNQVLIAVDQEGGLVQRLKGTGLDTIPSAAKQADLSIAELTTQAARWGEQLVDAGVHLNLAPVADVVPASKATTNEPIGKLGRGYGSTPDAVAERVGAVIAGFARAGLSASPKHFPNLGQVVGNTDFAAEVVDDVTTADDAALEPYRRAIDAGVDTVMVGTAHYTLIDADAPAAFSPTVVGILRDDLGFTGVIVSDDLGVAKAVADVPASQRAVRFVKAGGDLAISVDPDAATAMASGLAKAAADDPDVAARLAESAARVLTLKAQHGLVTCDAVVG